MKVELRIRLKVAEETAIGPGKADLLDAIERTGSISAAARAMGLSYRRAWLLVDTMNRCFASALVDSTTGGKHGGGARITTAGREVLAEYRRMQAAATAALTPSANKLSRGLRRP